MQHELLVESIVKATEEVFSTMLGADVVREPSYVESTPPTAGSGVMSVIGMVGNWRGSGSIAASPEVACRICSRMLMTESKGIDDEVLDAFAELTNMILGNVKTALEPELGPMGLSIPTVVYGRNFTTRSISQERWTVAPFTWDGDKLEVRLCLVPNLQDK